MEAVATFLISFVAQINNILLIVKVKILMLIKWSYIRSPQFHLQVNLLIGWLSYLEQWARGPIFIKHVFLITIIFELHQTTYHSNTSI